jgi:cell division inhibitor SepF
MDKLKSRLGIGSSWDSEYLEEGERDPNTLTDFDGEQAARDAYAGMGTSKPRSASTSAGLTQPDEQGERRYKKESPFASGAAPSAVTKHARKPDLKRASQVSGREIRDVEENRRYSSQPRLTQDGGSVFKPRDFSEAVLIGNHLKEGKAVSVDLSLVASSQRQRFIDFMAGLVFALDGHIARSSTNVYVLTPR